MERICLTASEEMLFENVDVRRTDGRRIHRGYSNFFVEYGFYFPSEVINIFIIYKVVKYRKILLIYNVYFIFSLVKI